MRLGRGPEIARYLSAEEATRPHIHTGRAHDDAGHRAQINEEGSFSRELTVLDDLTIVSKKKMI